MPATLWAGRLSMTTHAPGQRLGTNTCVTYVLNASPSVAPGKVISPTSPRNAIAPINVRLLPRWVRSIVVRPAAFKGAGIASYHCQVGARFIDKHQIF